jgi:hypothetical protein
MPDCPSVAEIFCTFSLRKILYGGRLDRKRKQRA